MKNFSSSMSPKGKTSLFIELFCFEGDPVWNQSDKELIHSVEPHLEKLGFYTRKEVREYHIIHQKNVYPIYDLNYKEHLSQLKNYLDEIPNLWYIGRPGRFRYNNQDHSLEMGILTAKSIIENKKYDIELVGEEKGYFESGKAHKSEMRN